MRLLLLGASGGVGTQVRGLSAGHTLRTVARGDVMVEDAVARALEGCDAVLSCLGIRRRSLNPWSALTSPPDFNSASARVLVAAMRRAGVRRVVAVSAAGVGDSAPAMNPVMRALVASSNVGVAYRDLAVMEEVYAGSGHDWTAVRPVALTDGPYTGKVREVAGFGMFDRISRADVAAWMLDRVARPETGARTPQIAGSRAGPA